VKAADLPLIFSLGEAHLAPWPNIVRAEFRLRWTQEGWVRRRKMRILLSAVTLSLGVVAGAIGAGPGHAQSPYQYPYCALDGESGATSCYYTSRAACGPRCIENPGYVGPSGAMASTRNGTRRSPRR